MGDEPAIKKNDEVIITDDIPLIDESEKPEKSSRKSSTSALQAHQVLLARNRRNRTRRQSLTSHPSPINLNLRIFLNYFPEPNMKCPADQFLINNFECKK